MTDMIERVARAMASQFGDVAVVMGEPLMGEYYRNAAITAIKAMREPSDEMVKAGNPHAGVSASSAIRTYQAMIDKTLESK